ncbi:type IX secretion system membrane protein PorP/SprF [Flavobacterium columnare]|uniref:PorP/SprF family type IX secretion system membrane protein n=1 Tax=Flavobacterium columnare TaxID=996 RepID=UPI002D21729D|nr:type IX secretion system membrane protein PorP/SprF [Flavobacterium columnare]MEB3800400.1 type IX secretion system membrane protein PorP/SprF [Flavobacterium columnare]
MKKYIYIGCLFLISLMDFAQQDPQYTHYMYNMSVVNPAYATAKQSVLDLGVLYRSQWVGAIGSPKTMTAFAHIPLNKKIEVGASLITDDVGSGAKKENNFYADFAYILQFGGSQRLSFGMKAGFTNLTTNFNGFQLESGNTITDQAFNKNINAFKPNVGVGAYYFSDKYYMGISVPNVLPTQYIEERQGVNQLGSEELHLFATAGYVFNINDMLKVKPSAMAKIVKGAPFSLDISANVLYNNRFELGASYRLDDSVSGLMAINPTKNFKLGYSYDHTLSNLGRFNSGTHEVFLIFNLDLLSKGYDKSPRFF